MSQRATIEIATPGRGFTDITSRVAAIVAQELRGDGLVHLFIQHTSASLIICENADPTVRSDLEAFMARVVPDGDPRYQHDDEGPDDMPAHIRSVLTATSLTVPIGDGKLLLGTWQGIYLWEHRSAPHRRRVVVTVQV